MSSAAGHAGRQPVEVVALAVGVDHRERHRRQHLVAERQHVLADRLAVGAIADHHHRHERPQAVDDQLARRRRRLRGDDDHASQAERLLGGGEAQRLVAAPVAIVVAVLGEHLVLGRGAADQAGQVHRDVHQAAAVVAQIEDQLGHPRLAQRRERLVERRHARPDEVAEEEVADLAAVHLEHPGERDGRNRDRALAHRRRAAAAVALLELDVDDDPFGGRAERRVDAGRWPPAPPSRRRRCW